MKIRIPKMKERKPISSKNVVFNINISGKIVTDKELVNSLIARDEAVTEEFFWVCCRPLFCSVIFNVFKHKIDKNEDVHKDDYYNEVVNMVYEYLMKPGKEKDEAHNLKTFNFQSSIFAWIKLIILRLIIKKKADVIEDQTSETPFIREGEVELTSTENDEAKEEVEAIFMFMLFDQSGKKKKGKELDAAKKRIELIRKLVLEGEDPANVAKSLNIKISNLYNLKKRALDDFSKAALRERNIR